MGRATTSTAAFTDPFSSERSVLSQEMKTTYLGTFDVITAFAPVIERNGSCAIVNVL